MPVFTWSQIAGHFIHYNSLTSGRSVHFGHISWHRHHIILSHLEILHEFGDHIKCATNSVNPCKSLASLNRLKKFYQNCPSLLLELYPIVLLSPSFHLDQLVSQLLVGLIGGQVQPANEDVSNLTREKESLFATCWNTCEPAGSWLGSPTSQLWTAAAHWNHIAPERKNDFTQSFGYQPMIHIHFEPRSKSLKIFSRPSLQHSNGSIPTLKPFMGTLEVPVTNWSSRDLISLLKDKTTRQYLEVVFV